QSIDAIVAMIKRAIQGHFDEGRRPARRDAHAIDNGCVRALFRIDRDLPKHLQHGVFKPGEEYRAWIGCSNGNSDLRRRWWPDPRGFAIKLCGIDGDKLMDDEKRTQDLILISHPSFFVDDLERYRRTLEAFLRGGFVNQYLVALTKLSPWEAWLAFVANFH